MPLAAQRLYYHVRNRLPTLAALRTVPVSMAVATPCIAILLNERRAGIKWITALRTEEMAGVPFSATGNDDFALDRRLARFAARAEHLVEVERAVEAERRHAIGFFSFVEFLMGDVLWNMAGVASCDAF